MKIEPSQRGRVKIWLTAADMRWWGLTFDTMSRTDAATRSALVRLLQLVRQRMVLPQEGAIRVEALPVEDGCLLLLTPSGDLLLREWMPPHIYALSTADDVMELGAALTAVSDEALPQSSLYQWGGEYRLVVYADTVRSGEWHGVLSEFADCVGKGYARVAHLEEHGDAVTVGNALNRLRAAYAPLPPVLAESGN